MNSAGRVFQKSRFLGWFSGSQVLGSSQIRLPFPRNLFQEGEYPVGEVVINCPVAC